MRLFKNSRTTDSLRLDQRARNSPVWGRAFAACALPSILFLTVALATAADDANNLFQKAGSVLRCVAEITASA